MTHPMLTVVDHPLVQHKLTLMRSREIHFPDFRRLMREITLVLGVEATRDLPLERVAVETPNALAEGARLRNSEIVIVPILRAGLIMAETLHELLPMARAGHLGLYRDHGASSITTYLVSVPDAPGADVIITDPMIATGQTLHSAASILMDQGVDAGRIRVIGLIATSEGIENFYAHEEYANIRMHVAAVDFELNENGFIVPGLGDAGDRQFGTKKSRTLPVN